jgi:plasmid stabilization system protein ParE
MSCSLAACSDYPYELSLAAEADMRGIIRYTRRTHGVAHVRTYTTQLKECALGLATGKGHIRTLSEIHPNLRLVHCQHHYIFGVMREDMPMLIVAFLHERMDIIQRLTLRL